eukprot:TRINITY_DN12796_c0_g1_i3.p1 TRINITY_DN12796_c0_g1~~TRINITY_DN12796_c0_g1_i3.p1  ORF type:complete len:270 (-),score=39.45 TRINITY_DN12796_c0_g1_i3:69-878(-)
MQKHLILWLGGYYKASYATCYALCTTSWHWAEVSLTSTSPTHPRFFPASALVNQQLFAWGGRYYSGGDDKYFDDLLELDLSTMARTYQLRAHVRHVPTSGTAPEAKFAATLTNVHDARLILFGGAQWKIGGACNPDSSLHVLDLHSRVWTHHLLARVPRPRLQHQARLIGRGELLLVLGGYDGRNKEYLGCRDWAVLNLRSLEWVRGALYDPGQVRVRARVRTRVRHRMWALSLIHISEPTRLLSISYAVFCLKKKKHKHKKTIKQIYH